MNRHRPSYHSLLRFLLTGVWALAALAACTVTESDELQNSVGNSQQGRLLAIGTLRLLTPSGYCFDLDEGHRLLPADTSAVSGFHPVEGQRAIVIFTPWTVQPDTYTGYLHRIEPMLTLDADTLSSQAADTLGHDPVSIGEAWLSAGYLNIRYQVMGDRRHLAAHSLRAVLPLARQQAGQPPLLELRHHAHGDTGSELCSGVASFRLSPLDEWLAPHRTLQLVVRPLFSPDERSYVLSK